VKDILFVDEVLGQHGKKVRGVFISFSLFYAFTANPIHSALENEMFWIYPRIRSEDLDYLSILCIKSDWTCCKLGTTL
jgi:hypothetical protein